MHIKHFINSSIAVCVIALLLTGIPASAHNINLALEHAPVHDVIGFYVRLGIAHIVPYGVDHILFVIALCLLNNRLNTIIWQASAFTVAHSITLALSMKNVITLPPGIVEPLIAFSIVFIAIENILFNELKPWRIMVIFLFGLLHGLGFAAALNEIGLPQNKFLLSILSFNAGVELGQLFVILFVYFLLIRPFGKQLWYKRKLVLPVSLAIALVALYWTVDRLSL